VTFSGGKAVIKRNNQIWAVVDKGTLLYKLNVLGQDCSANLNVVESSMLWHCRLGHLGNS